MTEEERKEVVRWYVLGTHGAHKEIKLRDALRKAGMESYVPLKYEIVVRKGKRQRHMLPAIAGLVFVKTSRNDFVEFTMRWHEQLFLRKSAFTHYEEFLTIGNKEMEQFMALSTAFPEYITYFKPEEVTLHEGELVRIQIGSKSYEAEIKRVKGKRSKQLVVEIPEVTTATITLTPDIMKLITRLDGTKQKNNRQRGERDRKPALGRNERQDFRKTRNLETDKKMLFDTARRLLFEVTKEHMEDAENQMALLDVKRIRERVATFKGVIPATEGELALAMYLASVLLNRDVEQATERLKTAIDGLKESSMLRLRMRLYLAKLSDQEEELETIQKEISGWNKLRLSPKQKVLVDDLQLIAHTLSL